MFASWLGAWYIYMIFIWRPSLNCGREYGFLYDLTFSVCVHVERYISSVTD